MALVAVAHGSRDPRSAATVSALVDVVRSLRPGLDVRLAFLDLCAPRLRDVLVAVHGDGHREAVVVPLLLGRAYHATVDLPGTVRDARARLPRLAVRIADVLGPDPRLSSAALRRLAAAGVAMDDDGLGVVLAAAGSSHPAANAAVHAVAAGWSRRAPWAGVHAAFAASSVAPSVPAAITALRARGARRIAVAPWFLAPGQLPDRVADAARATDPSVPVADPLGADPEVAQLVLDRYAAALAAPATATATAR
ncbi:MAG TPA: sirohydrochlorin chelatase [Pseudonocardiaceae bacterium]|jgi:sirohydrochlorin ferrochelatase